MLFFTLQPLPLADHNAPNLRYVVRYRKYDENNRDPDNQDAWQKSVSCA